MRRMVTITRCVGSALKKRRVALSARGPESPVADGQLPFFPSGPRLFEMTPMVAAEVANTSGILIVPHWKIILSVQMTNHVSFLFPQLIKLAKLGSM